MSSDSVILQCSQGSNFPMRCIAVGCWSRASTRRTASSIYYLHRAKLCTNRKGSELLAIVHACGRFDQCRFGREFTVETDHKPLDGGVSKEVSFCNTQTVAMNHDRKDNVNPLFVPVFLRFWTFIAIKMYCVK